LQQRQERLNAAPSVSRRSSPFVALALSLLVPGLGAAYNGQTSKALVHFGIFAGFFQIAVISNGQLFFVFGVLAAILFSAVDAYRTAQVIRAGLTPQAELDLIARRLYGNPLAWGVVLLVLGTIFLLHTIFNITMPMRPLLGVGIILLGAYMFYDYLRTRRTRGKSAFNDGRPPPSVVDALGSSNLFGAPTRFQTGELATQVSARPSVADGETRPFERFR
jgi:TM2 domain-containing membrane protein YozV